MNDGALKDMFWKGGNLISCGDRRMLLLAKGLSTQLAAERDYRNDWPVKGNMAEFAVQFVLAQKI